MKKKASKGGRPPKRKGERLSKNRTFRVRGNLDEWLIHAANESGRSVSEEIEYRLDQTFQVDDMVADYTGNEDSPGRRVRLAREQFRREQRDLAKRDPQSLLVNAAEAALRAAEEAQKAAEEAKKAAAEILKNIGEKP